MIHKAPGKAYREGITLLQLADRFPTEKSAVQWFEGVVWGDERACGHAVADVHPFARIELTSVTCRIPAN